MGGEMKPFGRTRLTDEARHARIVTILQGLANGLYAKHIAPQLGLKPTGMNTFLREEMRRHGVTTSPQFVAYGMQKGWIRYVAAD